jgi:hypothetical protein
MIQQQTFTRGNKQYTANFGTDEAGNFQLWIDETDLHASTQQPVRLVPEKIEIGFSEADGKGTLLNIRTSWKKVLLGNSGNPIPGTGGNELINTNKVDKADFAAMFGEAFQKFMLNGVVRSTLGHNYQPLFDAAGARVPDANYDTTLEPTNNYQTHNSDGTPIA